VTRCSAADSAADVGNRGMQLAKNDFGLVLQKTAVFGSVSVLQSWFRFFGSVFCTVCCLMCMHSTECFPFTVLFVSLKWRTFVLRGDSELEVQRYGMKKNTLTVDPIMLEGELWMSQREKPSRNHRSRFFENQSAETEFSVFKPPPPVGASGGYTFSGRPSVPLSVRPWFTW